MEKELVEVREAEGRQAGLAVLSHFPLPCWLPSGPQRAEGDPVDQRGAQMD